PIAFRGAEALGISSPTLAVVGLGVTGLLKHGLEGVAEVSTEVDGLVIRQRIFFARSHGLAIFGDVILGLEVGDDAEDAFGVFVVLLPQGRRDSFALGGPLNFFLGLLRSEHWFGLGLGSIRFFLGPNRNAQIQNT